MRNVWRWVVDNPTYVSAMFTVAIFFATCQYTIYSGRQWDTMQKQLEMSERPWVSVQVSITQPLTFLDRRGTVGILTILKNTGHSVALNVLTKSKLTFSDLNPPGTREVTKASGIAGAAEEFCSEYRAQLQGQQEPRGAILFPGDETRQGQILELSREDIEAGISVTTARKPSAQGTLLPLLITCVAYRFEVSSKHPQTRLTFFLGQIEANGAMRPFSIAPDGAYPDLQLIQTFIGEAAD